ncbi:MAG: glycosyltransferase [Verrucomicrobia bacterium]|nr:glycosyltransferase [Verrucomicrobiota bacterium]
MKVALVHDWLTGMRGGEKCLEVFCEMFPDARLHALLYMPGTVSRTIERMDIRVSPLQRLPFSASHYRYYLPFFPAIVEAWNTGGEEYDLVLSSCHCVAKGVKFRRARRRVCYCFTPMRYVWCQTDQYYTGTWKQTALNLVKTRLKRWDLRSNEQVDEFIGISNNVSDRIRRFYGRESATIHPPVDTEFYRPAAQETREPSRSDDFHLMVGALEPYKRVDLALEAFARWNRPLKIVGKGTMSKALRRRATSNVEFLGWKSDEEIRGLYQKARALIFPGEEDFGIVPLEAQACGCPVVAYAAGGALETVRANETGVFFRAPTSNSLLGALQTFETMRWDSTKLRAQAEQFGRERFRLEMERHLLGG